MGNKISLEDELINLRITSKSMNRSSAKCKKHEKAALDRLKKVCTASLKMDSACRCAHVAAKLFVS